MKQHELKVLIVDDKKEVRDMIQSQFEFISDARIVGEVSSGGAALDYLSIYEIDAVVLDLSMPGFGGTDLIRVMKSIRPNVNIIIYSFDERLREEALQSGASQFIVKPCTLETMEEAVHTL